MKLNEKQRKRNVTNLQIEKIEVLKTLTVIFPGCVVIVKQLILRAIDFIHLHHKYTELVQLCLDMVLKEQFRFGVKSICEWIWICNANRVHIARMRKSIEN